ncbi:MAG: efflux transporter outer membrane subunit [Betaproteobacteria bacterium]|nr:MAG: efflux transporter outer membrane subunit [Betaproteobacteria bacterium]
MQRPKFDTPTEFRFEPKAVAETADTAWWKRFGDPVLDTMIDEALANNVNLNIAVANVEQAAGVLTQTRSQLFPQIGYTATGEKVRTTEAGLSREAARLPNPQTAYQALLTASWEIDLWGRIRRQSEAALANVLASDDARRGMILSLVASVASDYIKLFELQFKYGQVSQMNVAQVQSEYETAAAQIPQIESQIAQTENALSILLGRNPGSIARGKSIAELMLPSVPSGIPSQLLERRPDLMQSEQQLIAANAQIGAAKALYFPTISLTGAFGRASGDLSNLFTGPARVWNYAGQAVGPIFTFGAVSGQVAQAQAGQQAALYGYQQSIQNAFADVANALVASQKLQEQVAAQGRLVAALKDYARLATLQYNNGYTSYTTVLQAEQSLFPAELTLASVRAQVFSSSVNIYKAMGGGWVGIADEATAAGKGQPIAERAQKVPLF